ncbi:MAG: hypothetical protein CVU43_04530 [Chloroflexi bacterium HGW-Chloroflexi-5]|jgi:hypothetical protein|nr:MAG: hypothetical protein CVU43_04530 [Chloroflexi bacterium HGW-Chloroflexi-5]
MPDVTESRVVAVMREYREELISREASVLEEMAVRWLEIERRLDADIQALQLLMASKKTDDIALTQQMIWKEERYQKLKLELQAAIRAYNQDYLIGALSKAQSDFGWLGVQASVDAVKASFPVGNLPRIPVMNKGAIEALSGFLSNGAPLNSLLKNDYPDALKGLTDALINSVARGLGPKAAAAEMANGMGMGLDRAMLISRTEIGRAYRSGNIQQYRESGVVKGFMRLVKKESACMACLLLDGERFATEDELDDHPQGNCQAVPVVEGVGAPKWEKGADWFAGLSQDEQQAKLGPQLFERWQKEGFDLSSLVSKSHSVDWGDTPRFNAGGSN